MKDDNPFEPTFDERRTKPAPKVDIVCVRGSLVDGVWEVRIDGRVWGTYPSAHDAQKDLEKALRRSD